MEPVDASPSAMKDMEPWQGFDIDPSVWGKGVLAY